MKKRTLITLLCIMICAVLSVALMSCDKDPAVNKNTNKNDTQNSESKDSTNKTESNDDTQNSDTEDSDTEDSNSGTGDSSNNDNVDDSQETPEEGSNSSVELDPNSFNIFYSGKYVCDIVLPKNATDIERNVATELKKGLQKKTGKQILVALEGDKRIDESHSLILLGETSYDESDTAYKGLKARSAKIKTTKTRMAIAFKNESSGIKVVEKLIEQINKGQKQALKIKPTFTASYTSLPERHEIVEYTGGKTEKIESENETVLYTSYGNSLSSFNDYCAKLQQIGFKIDQERTVNNNSFKTFKGEDAYVHAYYVSQSLTKDYKLNGTSYTHTTNNVNGVVKISVGSIENFAAADMTSGKSATQKAKLAIIPVPSTVLAEIGQGYVFVLPDGRLIVQDGGVSSIAAPDYMYNYIKQLAPDPDNVVIAAWFVSHPHWDHQGAFIEFVKNHGSDQDIKIERVIYNYTKAELYDLIRYDCGFADGKPYEEKCASAVTEFHKNVEQYIPNVPLLLGHTGQVFNFGNNVTVEVLFTVEDIVPDEMENPNNSSMVIRVNIEGQKVLMLADTAHKSNPMIVKMWGNILKSDIVQMAHHGCWTPDDGIYELIGAKTVLVPSSYINAKGDLAHSAYGKINQKVYDLASDIYVSDATMRILDLPYVIKNNKTAELNKINNAK